MFFKQNKSNLEHYYKSYSMDEIAFTFEKKYSYEYIIKYSGSCRVSLGALQVFPLDFSGYMRYRVVNTKCRLTHSTLSCYFSFNIVGVSIYSNLIYFLYLLKMTTNRNNKIIFKDEINEINI